MAFLQIQLSTILHPQPALTIKLAKRTAAIELDFEFGSLTAINKALIAGSLGLR